MCDGGSWIRCSLPCMIRLSGAEAVAEAKVPPPITECM